MATSVMGKCDIAVVGGGPVGITLASVLGALTKHTITVYDKRPETLRDHSLYIAPDGIDKILVVLNKALIQPNNSVNVPAVRELITILTQWRKHNVRTSLIEEKLTKFAHERLNITVHRDKKYGVKAESFDQFVKETGARLVIGTDGDKSEVRKALGVKRVDAATFNHLVELKYTTKPEIDPRGKLDSCSQATIAEGWDFETMGKTESGRRKTVALHKFVPQDIHQSLLVKAQKRTEKGDLVDITKGSTEDPWTMKELAERAKLDANVKFIYEHILRYFRAHELEEKDIDKERIVTFPMTVSRNDTIAINHDGTIILFGGDAGSTAILERGVNKGLNEVALCAEAVLSYIHRMGGIPKLTVSDPLPVELQTYEKKVIALFENEKWWAGLKNFGLNTSEFLLKCVVRPFKWALAILLYIPRLLLPAKP